MLPCPLWRSLSILGSYSHMMKGKSVKLTWSGLAVAVFQMLYWPVVLEKDLKFWTKIHLYTNSHICGMRKRDHEQLK